MTRSSLVLVVLDANVFVSAAIQRGASYRIVESWLTGTAAFDVVMCPALLAEIREVLTTRPRLRKWISLETATLFVDTIGSRRVPQRDALRTKHPRMLVDRSGDVDNC